MRGQYERNDDRVLLVLHMVFKLVEFQLIEVTGALRLLLSNVKIFLGTGRELSIPSSEPSFTGNDRTMLHGHK